MKIPDNFKPMLVAELFNQKPSKRFIYDVQEPRPGVTIFKLLRDFKTLPDKTVALTIGSEPQEKVVAPEYVLYWVEAL